MTHITEDFLKKKRRRKFEKLLFPQVAREFLMRLNAETESQRKPLLTVFDVAERLVGVDPPHHMKPYVDLLERMPSQPASTISVVAAPPQHGKTLTLLMALVTYGWTWPERSHAYITYNDKRAQDVMEDFTNILMKLNIVWHKKNSRVSFTVNGETSTVMFTSLHSSLTGYSINGISVIDDPIKDEIDATSVTMQERAWSFFTKTLMTRSQEKLSIVCMMTRWTYQDLSGKILESEWTDPANGLKTSANYLNIKAICDDPETDPLHRQFGEALWPERISLASLKMKRDTLGERVFSAMYQGVPAPKGIRIFNVPKMYSQQIRHRGTNFDVTYGVDLAYTASRSADWSVIVRLIGDMTTREMQIDAVIRRQILYRNFISEMKLLQDEMPGPMLWYASGMEAATAGEDCKRELTAFNVVIATKSKMQRSLATSEHWNSGLITVPLNQSQAIKSLVACANQFEGFNNGAHDDDVDALVAAHDLMNALWTQRAETLKRAQHSGDSERTVRSPTLDRLNSIKRRAREV